MTIEARTGAERIERRAERGASLVEYAMLLGLIAMVCFGAVAFVGDSTDSDFDSNGSSLFPG